MSIKEKINAIKGPILVIGASGFVGANILKKILEYRNDVVGTFFSGSPWRLHDIASSNIIYLNLQDPTCTISVISRIKPNTIFDCSSFGAYSFESEHELIHATNYNALIKLLEILTSLNITAYIHAGSSSEYGLNAQGPNEDSRLIPNSHYAISKVAASAAITFYGKINKLPVINLRLYSVYGQYEDSSRLIPLLCKKAQVKELPEFTNSEVSRDFIHIDDVIEAFVYSAVNITPNLYGESFNIGTGKNTSLRSLASIAKNLFSISTEPVFNKGESRSWDLNDWYADPKKAENILGWKAKISLNEGLLITYKWWEQFLGINNFTNLTKRKIESTQKNSVTAIIACYKDAEAIPVMHTRLQNTFNQLQIDYEIIFVNDCSPDNSSEVIREISLIDLRVRGINHSRNFGSQAAFRSGMELATKEACVLLDGDLQDPPEIIADFVREWRNGADIVYGVRVKREMSSFLEYFYKLFYRIFSALSDFPIPKNAGDFSLIDRTAVYWILMCEERDLFLRGIRAYVGFSQVGVNYERPERLFGKSTNNWVKNIGWAKKGIFSFSRIPLHALTAFGGLLCSLTILLSVITIVIRFTSPESTPKGITFLSLIVLFFGSSCILGIGLLGEYIGKIFEETKKRPSFIRKSLISRGEIYRTVK
jgi:nucleoside-diphosphate-sugar epimerase/glycosyltransferase involved in cell wall biosynthesis